MGLDDLRGRHRTVILRYVPEGNELSANHLTSDPLPFIQVFRYKHRVYSVNYRK